MVWLGLDWCYFRVMLRPQICLELGFGLVLRLGLVLGLGLELGLGYDLC
jgi:hypothetical protein